ncbi:sensor histidine kinase [Turicimonas muris]|uniref:sensor histidine kinase n=1 Tax=Turicimonas muris TaxID=1796652 RepID=UPI0024954AD1|nr:HAMP domain-containing sensor histidine kinase [Turicimonas muris]
MRKLLFALVCSLILLVGEKNALAEEFVVGVVKEATNKSQDKFIKDTVQAIGKELNRKVLTVELNDERFKSALELNDINAFIVPAFLYRQNLSKGFKDIGSLVSSRTADPNQVEGLTIFIDYEKSKIHDINSLKDKQIGILEGLESAEMILRHLLSSPESRDQRNSTQLIKFSSLQALISAMRNQKVEAIALPACYLENQAHTLTTDTSRLLPINGKAHGSMACAHSSALYPGMIFGLNPLASSETVSAISHALLSMEKGSEGEQWKIATDFRSTDRLLEELNLDENAQLRQPSLKKFLKIYWPWLVAGLLLIAGMAVCSLVLSYLVKRRTSQLNRSLTIQKELEEEAKSALNRLEKLQKLGAVGQMSSLFAHEIRQPLNAVLCYAFTLEKILEKQIKDIKEPEAARECLSQIQEQSSRIDQIVDKVRTYLKDRSTKRKACFINSIVQQACKSFKTTSSGRLPYEISFSKASRDCKIFVDPLEIELAIVNLFRNSVQASDGNRICQIEVKTRKEAHFCVISIEDNGPLITDSQLAILSEVQSSSMRPEGLGLGLAIVRFLIENHSGTVSFQKGTHTGLRVVIKLPLYNHDNRR